MLLTHSHEGRARLSCPSSAAVQVILMDPSSTTIPWVGNGPSTSIPPPCANPGHFNPIPPPFPHRGFDAPHQQRVHLPRELSLLLLFLWLIGLTQPCLKKCVCLFFAPGATISRSPAGTRPLQNTAGHPPVPPERANFICHPRLLLKPLRGLRILKVKVKVNHAYFFSKWIALVWLSAKEKIYIKIKEKNPQLLSSLERAIHRHWKTQGV